MNTDFPYQLVAFLSKEPLLNEPVYNGSNRWYSQIALKRRFKLNGISEDELFEKLTDFTTKTNSFPIHIGGLVYSDRMSTKVLEVEQTTDLMNFHTHFITFMGNAILSRYPERDGINYLPHITAQYNGKMVIDETLNSNTTVSIDKVFILKDLTNDDSVVYKSFELKRD